MNIYVINNLFFGFSAFLISILILLKRQDEVAKRWLYFGIFVTIYALAYAFQISGSLSKQDALFATRIANSGSAVIPAAWLYFICGFLGIERRKTLLIACSIAWLLLLSAPTALFIPFTAPAKGFPHYAVPGPLFHLHAVNFFAVVAYGFYLMVRSYLQKRRSNEERKEILMLASATVFGFIGGSSQYSLIYLRDKGIDLSLLLSTFPFLMAYVMIRHRVLDVEKLADAFQKEKLAAIGTLAASVNHELKNPLFVARGTMESYLQNMNDGIYQDGELKEASKKATETALRQLTRASEIMQKLTDFAKPYLGNDHLESMQIHAVLADVLELANSHFRDNKIRLNLEVEEDLAVPANRRQLEEIFFNLIMNACQAMEGRGGELTIRAWQKNGKAQIEIQDQGPGIAGDKINRIFEPFYTTKESGTGLGLYITKHLVHRNKGRIWVESKPNKGTCFLLEFQASKNREETDSKRAFSKESSESASVVKV